MLRRDRGFFVPKIGVYHGHNARLSALKGDDVDKLGDAVEAGLRKYFGHSGWSDAVFANARQYVVDAIRESGIVGVIDQNAKLVPRIYTDADAEAWSD